MHYTNTLDSLDVRWENNRVVKPVHVGATSTQLLTIPYTNTKTIPSSGMFLGGGREETGKMKKPTQTEEEHLKLRHRQ